MDSPDGLLLLLSIFRLLLFSFSVFTLFSCRFRAVDKLTHVSFRTHIKIPSRIVSYRIV